MRTIQIQLEGCVRELCKPGDRPIAKPVKGAKEALNRLANEGNLVILVTSAPWTEQSVTINWLMKYNIRYTLLLMGQPEVDEYIYAVDWDNYFLERDGKYDALALREVRKATKWFIERFKFNGKTLELSPADVETMPFPEFQYKLEYEGTLEFVNSERDFFRMVGQYDSLIALNVFEHTSWINGVPVKVDSLLKPGGRVYILIPFNLRFHGPKPDMWRITDTGLRNLFRNFHEVELTCYGPDTKPYAISAVFEK